MNETKTKFLKSYAFLYAFLLLGTLHLQAVTITWNGGSGSWFDQNNWDTGSIPTLADEVIISNGRVYIDAGTAAAKTIEIGPGSEFYVFQGQSLVIRFEQFINGIENNGYLVNMGAIEISNPTSQTNTGFVNYGTFYNRGGSLEIHEAGMGYRNHTNGITNNDGTIEIHDLVGNGGGGLSNLNQFTNEKGAEIILYAIDLPSYGISNFGSGANLYNHGEIVVENCPNMSGEAIQVTSGMIRNEIGGLISVDLVGNTGISVATNGTFRNKGNMYLFNCGSSGIEVAGFFVNHQKGYIFSYYNGVFGLRITQGGEFRNFGSLSIAFSGAGDFANNQTFNNYPKGKLYVSGHISNQGYFHNMGTMDTYHPGSHTIMNALNNSGVIGDRNDSFSASQINNNSVVVKPIYGNVEVGVPAANALELGSLNFVTLFDWTIAQSSSTSAGTYNVGTNEFTPNANAAGLTEIYVTIRVNNSGLKRKYLVPVPNGIQNPSPRLSGQASNLEGTLPRKLASTFDPDKKLLLYPNPSNGYFRLKNPGKSIQQVRIFAADGSLVYCENEPRENGIISLPSKLSAGMYQVVSIAEDGNHQSATLKLHP